MSQFVAQTTVGNNGFLCVSTFEFLAQGFDVGIDGAQQAVVGMWPGGLHQLVAAARPIGAAQKGHQQIQFIAS